MVRRDQNKRRFCNIFTLVLFFSLTMLSRPYLAHPSTMFFRTHTFSPLHFRPFVLFPIFRIHGCIIHLFSAFTFSYLFSLILGPSFSANFVRQSMIHLVHAQIQCLGRLCHSIFSAHFVRHKVFCTALRLTYESLGPLSNSVHS